MKRLAITTTLGILVTGTALAGPIEITSWDLVTRARENKFNITNTVENSVVLPFATTSTATQGRSESVTRYDFMVDGTGANLGLDWNHNLSPIRSSGGRSLGEIFLTVNEPMFYDFSGMNDTFGPQLNVLMVRFENLDTATDVFYNHQNAGRFELSNSLTLGLAEGTEVNILQGSPSGYLPSGNYKLAYDAGFQGSLANSYPGSGAGSFKFNFQTVPEGGTSAVMLGLGLLGLAGVQRGFQRV